MRWTEPKLTADVKPEPSIKRALSIEWSIASSTGVLSSSVGPLFEYEMWAWLSVMPGMTKRPRTSQRATSSGTSAKRSAGPARRTTRPSIHTAPPSTTSSPVPSNSRAFVMSSELPLVVPVIR